jgi:hypothetical protein
MLAADDSRRSATCLETSATWAGGTKTLPAPLLSAIEMTGSVPVPSKLTVRAPPGKVSNPFRHWRRVEISVQRIAEVLDEGRRQSSDDACPTDVAQDHPESSAETAVRTLSFESRREQTAAQRSSPPPSRGW